MDSENGTEALDLSSLVASLHRAAGMLYQSALVWKSSYEYSPVYVFGGTTGSYTLSAPYDTACEYRVLGATFLDAGALALSPTDSVSAPTSTTVLDPSSHKQAIILAGAANTYQDVSEQWQSMLQGADIYLNVSVTNSHTAYVLVQFRRRRNQLGMISE